MSYGRATQVAESEHRTSVVVSVVQQATTGRVYNFEVERWHTYFVGEDRTLVHNTCSAGDEAGVRWTAHGGKHVANSRVPWAEVIRSTERGPAKYLPGTAIEALERRVWAEGTPVTNGKAWKVMKFSEEIGASGGKGSRWVRVEQSGGTIHGHPITEMEYKKLTK